MHVSLTVWIVTIVVMVAALTIDAVLLGRRPHVPSMKECLFFVILYIVLALLFGLGIHVTSGTTYAGQFYAGWLTEYSLSIDNLFLFMLIMNKMKVPEKSLQFALLVGIMIALVFRGVFIALGAALISRLAFVFIFFGLWLIYTAYGLMRDFIKDEAEEEEKAGDGRFTQLMKRVVPATNDFREDKLFVRENGKLLATSLFFVVVALGSTDVMFALDSIPAIFGLTKEPYIVFTANVFALMGLRQLYFLLGDMLERLVYLPVGLGVLLTFIGIKLLLEAMHHYGWDHALGFSGEISTGVSLLVILAILVITAVASLLKIRYDKLRTQ